MSARDSIQSEFALGAAESDPGPPPAWITEPANEEAIASALAELDPEQQAAVTHGEGPLLIVAGAGTGKTRVIAHRIAYLIAARKAEPSEILALTFTERAAAEMEARVDLLVPYGYTDMWISTFHAFGDRIYREYALEMGLSDAAVVLNEAERLVFFRERLFRLPLRRLLPLGNPVRHLAALLRVVARAKDEGVTPERYVEHARAELAAAESDREGPDAGARVAAARRQLEIAETYRAMDEELHAADRIDFGDQLLLALRLLREQEHVLAHVRRRFRYILVDEFQDTNAVQFELLKLLAGERPNLTVVGDDDQSIYKFRGAAIGNILGFTAAYPERALAVLTRSYRSGQTILDAAHRLIQHNNPDRLEVQEQIDKRLRSMAAAPGAIEEHRFDILPAEADYVCERIRALVATGGRAYRDIAVLVRSNRDAEPFLTALQAAGIPHQFSGSRGLFQREEVRTAIAFLNAVARPADSQSLYALAASPVYRVPMADLATLADLAREKRRPLLWAFRRAAEAAAGAGAGAAEIAIEGAEPLSTAGLIEIARLMADLERARERARSLTTGSLLYEFLTDSGYLAELTAAETLEAEERVRNLSRFFTQITRYQEIAVADRVHAFVDHLELLVEAGEDPQAVEPDPDQDQVRVLTVHRAKGLEFPVVFVVNLVSQKFPTQKRTDPLELPAALYQEPMASGDYHMAEERRLFYVALTRARDLLVLTSAADHGGPRLRKTSQFVLEALDLPAAAAQSTGAAVALAAFGRHAGAPAPAPAPPRPIGPDEVIRLSWTQVDAYRECPLRYKYAYLLKAPAIPHHSQNYGKAVHAAIAELLRGKMRRVALSLAEVLEAFRKNWRSEGFLSREHEERRLGAGIRALERLHAEEAAAPVVPAQVEKQFSFPLGRVEVIGRFDRVDLDPAGATVIDYKTSEIEDAAAAARRAEGSDQLRLYALAYRAQAGVLPRALELRFVETGLRGRIAPEDADADRAAELVAAAEAGIRAGDFTAHPSPHTCALCAFNRICPQADL
jgi:DNA helicase-2/ATP-dependent DNA helicase PcrA